MSDAAQGNSPLTRLPQLLLWDVLFYLLNIWAAGLIWRDSIPEYTPK